MLNSNKKKKKIEQYFNTYQSVKICLENYLRFFFYILQIHFSLNSELII